MNPHNTGKNNQGNRDDAYDDEMPPSPDPYGRNVYNPLHQVEKAKYEANNKGKQRFDNQASLVTGSAKNFRYDGNRLRRTNRRRQNRTVLDEHRQMETPYEPTFWDTMKMIFRPIFFVIGAIFTLIFAFLGIASDNDERSRELQDQMDYDFEKRKNDEWWEDHH